MPSSASPTLEYTDDDFQAFVKNFVDVDGDWDKLHSQENLEKLPEGIRNILNQPNAVRKQMELFSELRFGRHTKDGKEIGISHDDRLYQLACFASAYAYGKGSGNYFSLTEFEIFEFKQFVENRKTSETGLPENVQNNLQKLRNKLEKAVDYTSFIQKNLVGKDIITIRDHEWPENSGFSNISEPQYLYIFFQSCAKVENLSAEQQKSFENRANFFRKLWLDDDNYSEILNAISCADDVDFALGFFENKRNDTQTSDEQKAAISKFLEQLTEKSKHLGIDDIISAMSRSIGEQEYSYFVQQVTEQNDIKPEMINNLMALTNNDYQELSAFFAEIINKDQNPESSALRQKALYYSIAFTMAQGDAAPDADTVRQSFETFDEKQLAEFTKLLDTIPFDETAKKNCTNFINPSSPEENSGDNESSGDNDLNLSYTDADFQAFVKNFVDIGGDWDKLHSEGNLERLPEGIKNILTKNYGKENQDLFYKLWQNDEQNKEAELAYLYARAKNLGNESVEEFDRHDMKKFMDARKASEEGLPEEIKSRLETFRKNLGDQTTDYQTLINDRLVRNGLVTIRDNEWPERSVIAQNLKNFGEVGDLYDFFTACANVKDLNDKQKEAFKKRADFFNALDTNDNYSEILKAVSCDDDVAFALGFFENKRNDTQTSDEQKAAISKFLEQLKGKTMDITNITNEFIAAFEKHKGIVDQNFLASVSNDLQTVFNENNLEAQQQLFEAVCANSEDRIVKQNAEKYLKCIEAQRGKFWKKDGYDPQKDSRDLHYLKSFIQYRLKDSFIPKEQKANLKAFQEHLNSLPDYEAAVELFNTINLPQHSKHQTDDQKKIYQEQAEKAYIKVLDQLPKPLKDFWDSNDFEKQAELLQYCVNTLNDPKKIGLKNFLTHMITKIRQEASQQRPSDPANGGQQPDDPANTGTLDNNIDTSSHRDYDEPDGDHLPKLVRDIKKYAKKFGVPMRAIAENQQDYPYGYNLYKKGSDPEQSEPTGKMLIRSHNHVSLDSNDLEHFAAMMRGFKENGLTKVNLNLNRGTEEDKKAFAANAIIAATLTGVKIDPLPYSLTELKDYGPTGMMEKIINIENQREKAKRDSEAYEAAALNATPAADKQQAADAFEKSVTEVMTSYKKVALEAIPNLDSMRIAQCGVENIRRANSKAVAEKALKTFQQTR